jgi:hypothetical protein
MDWHVYRVPPIDFGWQHLRTVEETLRAIMADANDAEQLENEGLNSNGAAAFLAAWDSAKSAATSKKWEGDFREEPAVFWLPAEGDFDYAFVFKQDNNGDTFVVSPHKLPWLLPLAC